MTEHPGILNASDPAGYAHPDAELNPSHIYLLPTMENILAALPWPPHIPKRIFDLGCGNGSVAARLHDLDFDVVGVDPSADGICQANRKFAHLKLYKGSAYDDLAAQYGQFPAVISLEVVEHVYFPKRFAACLYDLVQPGGTAIISTPYHGYAKNLVLALTGKMDNHFTALWDHGHIKFWSMHTLAVLLRNAGFASVRFRRVGRIPAIAKSMVAIARK